MTAKLKVRLEALRSSYAFPTQVLRIIEMATKPSTVYSFAVVPCNTMGSR
jgi:hypothetical protein